MKQQIDRHPPTEEHQALDKRLAVVESNYVTRELVSDAKSEMRGWLLVQVLTLVFAIFGTYTFLLQKIDAVEDHVVRLDMQQEAMNQRLDKVEQRLDKVEQRLDKVEQRLDKVEQRLDEIEQQLAAIQRMQREILKEVRAGRHR
jgi:septal ring factor EnvC (AmiA/AmiB activator)